MEPEPVDFSTSPAPTPAKNGPAPGSGSGALLSLIDISTNKQKIPCIWKSLDLSTLFSQNLSSNRNFLVSHNNYNSYREILDNNE